MFRNFVFSFALIMLFLNGNSSNLIERMTLQMCCLLAPTLCGIKHRLSIKSEFIQLCVEHKTGVATVKCIWPLCAAGVISLWFLFKSELHFCFCFSDNLTWRNHSHLLHSAVLMVKQNTLGEWMTKHSDWKLWVTLTFIHVAVTASSWEEKKIKKHSKTCMGLLCTQQHLWTAGVRSSLLIRTKFHMQLLTQKSNLVNIFCTN